MKPLVALPLLEYPGLGIESLSSYLRRLAGVYSVSAHQMLRFLCESKEVSDLVHEAPFRADHISQKTLGGYAPSVRRFAVRLDAAIGKSFAAKMTLLRIGPALTANCMGVISFKRRHCLECVREMKLSEDLPLGEPLIWTLATISTCPVHGTRLEIADGVAWHGPDAYPSDRPSKYECWQVSESMKLLEFCSAEPLNQVITNAPQVFLSAFIRQRHLALADFVQLTGLPYGNLKRQIDGRLRVSLKTLFAMAQRLALSPLDILADPLGAARSETLFSIADHAREVTESAKAGKHPHHAKQVYEQLKVDMTELLASDKALPALRTVCHSRGVSTGFARYRMSDIANKYQARRCRESIAERTRLRKDASRAAEQALRGMNGAVSLKRTEQMLRKKTGLAKHILSPALRRALVEKGS